MTDVIPLLVVAVLGGWLLKGRLSRLGRKLDALPAREELSALVQRFDRFEGAKLLEEGKPDELFGEPKHARTREFLSRVL